MLHSPTLRARLFFTSGVIFDVIFFVARRGILGLFASHAGDCPPDGPVVSRLIGLPAFT